MRAVVKLLVLLVGGSFRVSAQALWSGWWLLFYLVASHRNRTPP